MPGAGGNLLISDTTFDGPNGRVFGDTFSGTGYAQLERVTFHDSELTLSNYTLVLRDVTLQNTVARLIRDYPLVVENVTSEGQPFDVDAAPQGTLLDTIAVRDVTSPPGGQSVYTGFGLGLTDGNFRIGPDVRLTNNTFPVRIVSAGILPGSTLPGTGNIQDLIYVPAGDHGGASTIWADAGLPYFIAGSYAQHGGSLKMLEGVQVKLAPFADISSDPSPISCDARFASCRIARSTQNQAPRIARKKAPLLQVSRYNPRSSPTTSGATTLSFRCVCNPCTMAISVAITSSASRA